ncbi:SAM-dependent methyltransferase [hydrothermal vent metagenome]|uniref:SAM-dependent methyltransferase n=1 Tax=hydrothermal vent metagenome TaxID=652676 RepID=A0A1W1D1Q2_9ZZZZ
MSNCFLSDLHTLTPSEDGSFTAYSKEYDEHYHSTKDGALYESLVKHVKPTFANKQNKQVINILDICYGLGFNTLATLYYHRQNNLHSKLRIYSPELDATLINSLDNFPYPKEFAPFKHIIQTLTKEKKYEDENFYIEIFIGDAREYIKQFHHTFDIVYQDAFSPNTNPILWTKEYFYDIAMALKEDGILSTYSTALKTRLALYENNFFIYLNRGENFRNATIASLQPLNDLKEVDMKHKIKCNPHIKPLMDCEI